MSVMEAIKKRKSIRQYSDQKVSDEVLQQVLEAARLSPSASNRQRWQFLVIKDQEVRNSLIPACCDQKFIAQGDALIVICGDQGRTMRCGQNVNTIDCSIALSFMMLEATDLGLGMCWIGAFYEDQVRKILNIPSEFEIVALTPIGYPSVDGNPHQRKTMDEIVRYETWE